MTLCKALETMRGKRVLIAGLGVSNKPVLRLLRKYGIDVTVWDKNIDGGILPKGRFDIAFRTPGIRPDAPVLATQTAQGCVLTSEMELFMRVCPCKLIAVTGSDGKTTTSALIAEMLRAAGHTTHLGGNIGTPLLEKTEQMSPEDFAVVELSSFQLMTMVFSPDVAVVTNIAPNHLDWHTGMDEYLRAKQNVYLHQRSGQKLVTDVPFREVELLIPGRHNILNFLMAEEAVRDYVTPEAVEQVRRTFKGVPHRLELVRELDGVRYINDSIASSPTRCIAGLRSFPSPVILIAGGSDKKLSFDELAEEICVRCKRVILTGQTALQIRDAVLSQPNPLPVEIADSLSIAVTMAKCTAESGDIVLLSPACASFDRFCDFTERGKIFKELVNSL